MSAASLSAQVIRPDWPAPGSVQAVATTRVGGVSTGSWAAFNLGDHVADDAAAVVSNRHLLQSQLNLPAAPVWLHQVHGKAVALLDGPASSTPTADAALTTAPGVVCAVLTADCLPVLFCNRAGTHVAAAHAGWRGLADGILEATVAALVTAGAPAHTLLAWLGPAIGPEHYEVGAEVRDAFIRSDSEALSAFVAGKPGHWLLNLYAAARQRLQRAGVTHISGGSYCTFSDSKRFYSYRRDAVTGRQATLIWRNPAP